MEELRENLLLVGSALSRCTEAAGALVAASRGERAALLAAVRDLEGAAKSLEAAARAVRWSVNHSGN